MCIRDRLKALYQATDKPGQYSFEARMACGFGACMGCSCKTKYGTKRCLLYTSPGASGAVPAAPSGLVHGKPRLGGAL